MQQKDACNNETNKVNKILMHPKNVKLFAKNDIKSDDFLIEFNDFPQFIFDQYSNIEMKEKIKVIDTSKLREKNKNKLF